MNSSIFQKPLARTPINPSIWRHRNYSNITFRCLVILLIDWPVYNMTLSPTALKRLQCSLSNVKYKNRKYELWGCLGSFYLNRSISWLKADISYPNWSYFGRKKMHPLYSDFRISPKKGRILDFSTFSNNDKLIYRPVSTWLSVMEVHHGTQNHFLKKLALNIFLNKKVYLFYGVNNSFSWKFQRNSSSEFK